MLYMDNNISLDWQPIIKQSLAAMDKQYLQSLNQEEYLPKTDLIFSAFATPLKDVKYVLLGESPYPRAESVNGYAFWDNAIDSIWSTTGFSKQLNRATSLRNFIKMLLFVRGDLTDDFSQTAIAQLDKTKYLQTISNLFNNLLAHGFLLLNSSLIYSPGKVTYHAKQWQPFINFILQNIITFNPDVNIILLGKISKKFANIGTNNLLIAEHPYNISFITNPAVNAFFKPFDLLSIGNV